MEVALKWPIKQFYVSESHTWLKIFKLQSLYKKTKTHSIHTDEKYDFFSGKYLSFSFIVFYQSDDIKCNCCKMKKIHRWRFNYHWEESHWKLSQPSIWYEPPMSERFCEAIIWHKPSINKIYGRRLEWLDDKVIILAN